MPVRLVRLFLVALVGVIGLVGTLGLSGAPAPASAQVGSEGGSARIDNEECRFLGKINSYRRKNGLKPVDLDRDLNEAADHHSRDMAKRNYFSHKLKGGKDWDQNIRSFGYKGNPIGENIYAGSAKAGAAFKAWKKSRGHRKAMLDRSFGAIGVGRAFDKGSKYGWYWTTTFGGPVENKVSCR